MNLTTTAQVNNGKLDNLTRELIQATLKGFEGKQVNIEIKLAKNTRSTRQNRYWFVGLDKYAKPVFNETGDNWDAWKIHEYVMTRCGYTEVLVDPNGEPYQTRMHSSNMEPKVFNEMIEKCHAYLLIEHNINIPLPDTYDNKIIDQNR